MFFGGTLLGGAVLIMSGLVAVPSSKARRVCVVLGAAMGMLASAWTILAPVLAITVIVGNVQRSKARDHPSSRSRSPTQNP